MSFKEATDTDPGDSTKYGAPDIKKIAQYLNGTADVATAVIDSSTTIQNGKLHVATITNTGTITLPTATTTLVGRDTTDTLTNKTLTSPTLTAPLTVANGGTGAGTLTGLVTGNGTSAFTAVTAPSGAIVGDTDTQILTNKTLTNPIIDDPLLSGSADVLTLPAGPDTLVGRDTTDILTNKTLTLPVITAVSNSGTVTFPTGTLTLASLTGTENLTNKTLDSTNTISSATSLPIVTVAKGGTGQATATAGFDALSPMTTLGDIIVGDASGTRVRLGVGAANLPLKVNSGATNIEYGILPIAGGGTGQTTATLGFDALSPMTTAGDVIIGGASGTRTRLGIGTANQLLRTNSGATAPEWASTLSGLTLTAPVISTISNTGTLTLPNSTDTLVGRDTTDTLTNKTLTNPTISQITSGGSATTFYRAVNTVDFGVGVKGDLNNSASAQVTYGNFTVAIEDNTASSEKGYILAQQLLAGSLQTSLKLPTSGVLEVGVPGTRYIRLSPSGLSAARTITFNDANTIVVGEANTQTLTNKTLTAPVISTISNTGTVTLPTSTDTLVGKATTDVLTNKSVDAATNTFQKVRVFPSVKKHGAFYGTSTNASDGCIAGMVAQTAVLTGTTGLPATDASGTRATWSSGTTINSLSGWRATGAGVWFCRALNPVTAWKIDLVSAADVRFFAGYVSTTAAPASSADPGNAISTVGFWLDTGVDGNWHIMQNNGTGASDITTIANVAAADTSAHTFALRAVEASTKFQYAYGFTNLASASWVDINTDIPASTTGLTLRFNNECLVGSAAKVWHMWWCEHEQDA